MGGRAVDLAWLGKRLAEVKYIAAADGGAESLYKLGIAPDFWTGDMDSSSSKVRAWLKGQQTYCVEYDAHKAHTDGYLAWKLLSDREGASFEELYLLQALGGRLDHQLANLGLLKAASYALMAQKKKMSALEHVGVATIVEPNEQLTILPPMRMQLMGARGGRFSLQAYGDRVAGLSIRGAEYELQSYDLALGEDLTISNSFTEVAAEISWTAGDLLLWVEGDCRWQRLN